jgi:hypothetical protein
MTFSSEKTDGDENVEVQAALKECFKILSNTLGIEVVELWYVVCWYTYT